MTIAVVCRACEFDYLHAHKVFLGVFKLKDTNQSSYPYLHQLRLTVGKSASILVCLFSYPQCFKLLWDDYLINSRCLSTLGTPVLYPFTLFTVLPNSLTVRPSIFLEFTSTEFKSYFISFPLFFSRLEEPRLSAHFLPCIYGNPCCVTLLRDWWPHNFIESQFKWKPQINALLQVTLWRFYTFTLEIKIIIFWNFFSDSNALR